MNEIVKIDKILIDNLCNIIDEARQQVAVSVSNTMTMMYWHIGDTIHTYVLEGQRVAYGQQIVSTLSTKLTELYGKDFTDRNLRRMIQFSQAFPKVEIVSTLSTKLYWSHFMEVLPLKDNLAREFYVAMAASEHWSVKRLRKEIDSMLFERTIISRKPEDFIHAELRLSEMTIDCHLI